MAEDNTDIIGGENHKIPVLGCSQMKLIPGTIISWNPLHHTLLKPKNANRIIWANSFRGQMTWSERSVHTSAASCQQTKFLDFYALTGLCSLKPLIATGHIEQGGKTNLLRDIGKSGYYWFTGFYWFSGLYWFSGFYWFSG